MKKLKNFLSARNINTATFVLIVGLVLAVTVGVAWGSISLLASQYGAEVQMQDIGTSLLENGSRVSWRDKIPNTPSDWDVKVPGVLCQDMLQESNNKLELGKEYTELLSVRNSGNMDEYVRVSITKYWCASGDPNTKYQELDPSMIDLHLVNLGSEWIEDESARTETRCVLYYRRILPVGEETPLFADTLTIAQAVGNLQNKSAYNGKQFYLQVDVDAVQTHNAQQAVSSAWGRAVLIDPDTGNLTLN